MYTKMLATLDGSELSECILNHIKTIATGCRVPEVILLRVVEPPIHISEASDDYMQKAEERVIESAKNYLAQVANKLQKEGVNVSITVREGKAADEILDFIKVNKIDLVVMGTHGRSGVARWTMGSVADKIARHSGAPVLMVAPAGCRA